MFSLHTILGRYPAPPVIPDTGGEGIKKFMTIGGAILGAALILLVVFLIVRKKSRNDEADEGEPEEEAERE